MVLEQKEKILNKIKDQSKLIFCDDFEIVVQQNYSKDTVFSNREKIYQKDLEELWVGLRVIQRKQLGQAYGIISNDSDISELVERALLSAANSHADPWFHFPVWKPWNNQIDQLPKPVEKKNKEVFESILQDSIYSIQEEVNYSLSTSLIFRKTEKKSIHIESELEERNFLIYNNEGFFIRDKEVSQEVLQEKFKTLQEASQYSGDHLDKNILVSPQIFSSLINLVLPLFDLKGKEHSQISKGEKIFSECITLVASGTSPISEMQQKYLFDIEGVPIKKNILVSKGIFNNYFFDTYFAAKENAISSGNRIRNIGNAKPTLGAHYNYVEINPHVSEKEIISDVEEGIIIEFLDKMHIEPAANLLSASVFILGHGYEVIKNKKVPKKNIFIQCSIFDLLNNAVQLTNTLKFYRRIGSPWMLSKMKSLNKNEATQ